MPRPRSASSARPSPLSPERPGAKPFEERVAGAHRALVLGIGGGGDVVGALAAARQCEQLGTPFVLGGVAWERLPVDPVPGPRSTAEILGGRPIGDWRDALRSPDDDARGSAVPRGARRRTSGPADGPDRHHRRRRSAPRRRSPTAAALDCDLVVLVDIGGDAIADGSEPGLGSPLCDAVMIAAGFALGPRIEAMLAVLGPGCDGELEPDEVLSRVAALAAAGAWIGSSSVRIAEADEIEIAAAATGTEASVQMARCARGATGRAPIRGGRRSVPLGPLGALGFWFDLASAAAELPLATAVATSNDLGAARDALVELGVSTELDFELRTAAAGSA